MTADIGQRRRPVWIVTGFLGAGKTSLINTILANVAGLRLAVLVNEFGELGIDGALIGAQAASMIEVPNGCICCAARGDLRRGLAALLENSGGIDGVLIEASGLAQPLGVVELVNEPRFSDQIYLDAIVTLVDAANFDTNLDNAVVAFEQLVAADLLVVNKLDLVGEEVVAAIETNLSRLNPSAGIVRWENGQVPAWVLGHGDPPDVLPDSRSEGRSECVPEPGVDSLSYRVDQPVDRHRFEAWVAALPSGAWRVKALLRFVQDGKWFSYHRVGARETLTVLATEYPSRVVGGVVVIGRHLDHASLAAGLRHCYREEDPACVRVS